MKIRLKLNLALIAITFGGLLGLGLMYTAINSSENVQKVIETLNKFKDRSNELSQATTVLLTSEIYLGEAITGAEEKIKQYEASLEEILKSNEIIEIFTIVAAKNYADKLKQVQEEFIQNNPNDKNIPTQLDESQLDKSFADTLSGFWGFAKGKILTQLENLKGIDQDPDIPASLKKGVFQLVNAILNYPDKTDKILKALTVANRSISQLVVLNESSANLVTKTIGPSIENVKTITSDKISASIALAIGLTLGFAFTGLIIVAIFNLRLVKRIYNLELAMKTVAEKNLTHAISDNVRDEVGTLANHINSSIQSLSGFIGEVQTMVMGMEELKKILAKSSQETSSAITEISQNIESYRQMFDRLEISQDHSTESVNRIALSIENLNQNIENQSKAITVVSNAIHRTNESIKNIANITNTQNQKTNELTKVIGDGGEFVGKTNESINTIAREITDINEIISIINTISDQTNLLSMNAAIESAHAGEAGKGFSIVAEEIRKLADSTAENAKRISEIIMSITEQISEAKTNSEQSASTFDFIRNDVTEFTHAFSQISEGMNNLILSSNEIVSTNKTIEAVTTTLRNESSAMSFDAQDIRKEMITLSNISSEVVSGFGEIEAGTNDMLKNQLELREVSLSVAEQVEKLFRLINEFQVKDESLISLEIQEETDSTK